MGEVVFLNGDFVPREEAVISVEDRGFVFADAIYEVIKCYSGRPFRLQDHLERLDMGAEAIRLTIPVTSSRIEQIIERLIAINDLGDEDASIFIQVSRGPGPRDHYFPPEDDSHSTVVISATVAPYLDPVKYGSGIAAITVPDRRWQMCNVKSVGLLLNALAKEEARAVGAQDAIFVRDGVLTEGASTNFFVVHNGKLVTHPEGPHILSGVTRRVVLEIAEEMGYPTREVGLPIGSLVEIEEAFLAGTGTEILPVANIDGSPVGSGSKGPITGSIQRAFRTLTRGQEDEIHERDAV